MNRVFEHRGDLVAFVKEIRGYNTLTDAVDAMCDLLKWQAGPLAASSSPAPPALQRLRDALAILDGPCGRDDRSAAYNVCSAAKALADSLASSPAWEPKLKALIERWRDRAGRIIHVTTRHPDDGARQLLKCADELEALLPPPPKEQP